MLQTVTDCSFQKNSGQLGEEVSRSGKAQLDRVYFNKSSGYSGENCLEEVNST